MKSTTQVLADLDRKVAGSWAATVCAEHGLSTPTVLAASEEFKTPDTPDTLDTLEVDTLSASPEQALPGWPLRLPIGRPTKTRLRDDWPAVRRLIMEWRDFETRHTRHTVKVEWANRLTDGIREPLPTHLTIPNIDAAVGLLGKVRRDELSVARARLADLLDRFPHAASAANLTRIVRLDEVDYALLLTAANWFAEHDATGLTPRQVPIEGIQGKWLNHHRRLLHALADKEDLGLKERPTRVHFTYLDPRHRETGRVHDSLTLTDDFNLPYPPRIVLIAENKDTVVYFPPVPDAIVIEGNGNAGPTLIPQVPWVHHAERIIYWGDLDAAGYVILNRYRANQLPVESLLMDQLTYDTYEQYGAWIDERKVPIPCRDQENVEWLTSAEREVYDHLTDPAWHRVRRIEQERIPLTVAARHLQTLLATPSLHPRTQAEPH